MYETGINGNVFIIIIIIIIIIGRLLESNKIAIIVTN